MFSGSPLPHRQQIPAQVALLSQGRSAFGAEPQALTWLLHAHPGSLDFRRGLPGRNHQEGFSEFATLSSMITARSRRPGLPLRACLRIRLAARSSTCRGIRRDTPIAPSPSGRARVSGLPQTIAIRRHAKRKGVSHLFSASFFARAQRCQPPFLCLFLCRRSGKTNEPAERPHRGFTQEGRSCGLVRRGN